MLSDQFLHPDHVIPSSKLIPAVMEQPNSLITHMTMELNAVLRQILVLFFWESNTRIEVQDILGGAHLFKRLVKRPSNPPVPALLPQVNGRLCRPRVCSSPDKRAGVRVSKESFAVPCYKIWICVTPGLDPLREFLNVRYILFK